MMQSRKHSLIESITNIVVGYGIALLSQLVLFPMFGIFIPLSDNIKIGALFTVISLARSYVLRRIFTNYQLIKARLLILKLAAINAVNSAKPKGIKTDVWDNAKKNAKKDCPKCHGTGQYYYDNEHGTICALCCQHNMGWWKLEKHYGKNNGKWCCKAGCGTTKRTIPKKV